MTPEHLAYHALACTHRGNYGALTKLIETHGSWGTALAATRTRRTSDPDKAWQLLDRHAVSLSLRDDPAFPALLREIPFAPHGVYWRGAPVTDAPAVAIVGTRRATRAGEQVAGELAAALAGAGLTVVSGLAFGIDVAAHRAVVAQKGVAVAVLAGGLDTITPRSNAKLGEQILESGGALISEYPPETDPLPRFFLERNRLVSGLSRGVIVVEAPERSGTLATARFAIEQNREVFVVPGAVGNPNYAGSHGLIKQGATLITTAADVLDALGIETKKTDRKKPGEVLPFLDEPQQRIVDILTRAGEPLHADLLAEQTLLGASVLNEAIAMLTIAGILKEEGGRYYL